MTSTRIDVHAHYLGGALQRAQPPEAMNADGTPIPRDWTADGAIEFMDRHDISAQILSLPHMFTADGDPGSAARAARQLNQEYATLIERHPGRFGAFAALPADTPHAALAEIDYALDSLCLDGVLLTSNTRGRFLGDLFFEPILAELARRQTPILIHPTDPPYADVLGLGRPSSVIEYPFDTARTITNAIYTGVFQRHPDLKIILCHCGGPLPSLGWRIAEHAEIRRGSADADITSAHVTEVLHDLYYDTALAASRNSLLPTLEVTDADHILFGTDWPTAPERTVTHSIDLLAGFGFHREELTAVEHDNAARLFHRFA